MTKKLFVLGSILGLIAGCAVQPKPTSIPPPPKCIQMPGEGCKKISAGNVGGTTLGHHANEDDDLPAKAGKP